MRLKITNDISKLFVDNAWLKLHDVFKPMHEEEVIFTALVADNMSPFALLDEKRRRQNALKCVSDKYRTEWVKGTNARIEKAIPYYMENINPKKTRMIKDALDGYIKQHDTISKLLQTTEITTVDDEDESEDGGKAEKGKNRDLITKQKLVAQMVKDKTQANVWGMIEYYEKLLSYQYEPPAEVKDDMKGEDGTTIDDLDLSRL